MWEEGRAERAYHREIKKISSFVHSSYVKAAVKIVSPKSLRPLGAMGGDPVLTVYFS